MKHLKHPMNEGIYVVDYGSQYTLLIARRLREIGVYSEVIPAKNESPLAGFHFYGVILSGGPESVSGRGFKLPDWILTSGKPVLGICYGMQALAEAFGGSVRSAQNREFGRSELHLDNGVPGPMAALFSGIPKTSTVWMSHADDVEKLPPDFVEAGHTNDGVMAAVVHKEKPYAGFQFHPEVHHTDCGTAFLQNFVTEICKAPLLWQPGCMIERTSEAIRDNVGSGKVLMAVSGGVDSTVAAVLLAKALPREQLTAVFVDNGLLRKNEVNWVQENFRSLGISNFLTLDSRQKFLSRLRGVTEPEEKRLIIGRTFIEEFEAFTEGKGFTHLGQGTLYPDVIESAGEGAGAKVIKSHHNVGGLPERLHLQLVEPFRYFFKDEVRRVGESLGISHDFVMRHPFPGPGLAVRVLGAVDEEKLQILRAADHIFIQSLRQEGLYDQVWQAFAVLLPVRSVGVMGDNRTYEWTCALRAVSATDGMTATVSELPLGFLNRVADEIVRKVHGINRVVYDITSKPPATIEWE